MRLHAFEDLHVARGAKRTEHGADRKASFLRDCRKRGTFVPKLRQTPGIDFDPRPTKFHATPARRLLTRFTRSVIRLRSNSAIDAKMPKVIRQTPQGQSPNQSVRLHLRLDQSQDPA